MAVSLSFALPIHFLPPGALDVCSTGLMRDAIWVICKQGPLGSPAASSAKHVEVVVQVESLLDVVLA